jgi:hypothetical protein
MEVLLTASADFDRSASDNGTLRNQSYVYRDNRPPRFQRVKAPGKGELEELVQLISQRVGRCLEEPAPRAQRVLWVRQGLLEQDTESAWLDLDGP